VRWNAVLRTAHGKVSHHRKSAFLPVDYLRASSCYITRLAEH
jgi:hypothetical protein